MKRLITFMATGVLPVLVATVIVTKLIQLLFQSDDNGFGVVGFIAAIFLYYFVRDTLVYRLVPVSWGKGDRVKVLSPMAGGCVLLSWLIIGVLIWNDSRPQQREWASPFSKLIPSCESVMADDVQVAPRLWFEGAFKMTDPNDEGLLGEPSRRCQGNKTALFMTIKEFRDELSARTYFERKKGMDIVWPPWPPEGRLKNRPDEILRYEATEAPTLEKGARDEWGIYDEGVMFRVGRYVGDYEIRIYGWLLGEAGGHAGYWGLSHGGDPGLSPTFTEALWNAIDDTIPRLRQLADT